MQQAIAEKDRQHAEEVDTMGDEIRAAEHASERSERKLERKRATLAEDYRFIRSLITGNPRLVTGKQRSFSAQMSTKVSFKPCTGIPKNV